MQVKNNKTGKVYEITPVAWERIKGRGEADKFTVTSTAAKKGETPEELEKADYSTLIRKAATAYGAFEFERAETLYQAAYDIKKTKFVAERLEELRKTNDDSEPQEQL